MERDWGEISVANRAPLRRTEKKKYQICKAKNNSVYNHIWLSSYFRRGTEWKKAQGTSLCLE